MLILAAIIFTAFLLYFADSIYRHVENHGANRVHWHNVAIAVTVYIIALIIVWREACRN